MTKTNRYMIFSQIYSNICLITISNLSTHKLVEYVIFAIKQNTLYFVSKSIIRKMPYSTSYKKRKDMHVSKFF